MQVLGIRAESGEFSAESFCLVPGIGSGGIKRSWEEPTSESLHSQLHFDVVISLSADIANNNVFLKIQT